MRRLIHLFLLSLASIPIASTCLAGDKLAFTDVSDGIFSGICANLPDQGFGHPMAEWEPGVPYLFAFDHWNARHNHCAFRWNGSQFVLQGNNHESKPTGLSGDLSYGTNSRQGCCGWTVEMLDIDGDGDLDLHGRSTEGVDGYFENTGKNSAKWRTNSNWAECAHAVNSYFFDADGDGVINPGKDCVNLTKNGTEHFFDSDNDGTPNFVKISGMCKRIAMFAYFDFENDGDTDIYCQATNADDGVTEFRKAINNNGEFTVSVDQGHRAIGGISYAKSSSTGVDINNDGYADWIGPGRGADGPIIMLSNGDGTFTKSIHGNFPTNEKNGVGVFDYDSDCDLDLVYSKVGSTNNLMVLRNDTGGNCLKVAVKPYDRVIVRNNKTNDIVFSYEYITRHRLAHPFGYVHVGLGSLAPSEVTCTRHPIGKVAPISC